MKTVINNKKINNKGLTLIELILCFVIVSVIVVALLNTIMNYKDKEQVESTRSAIITYKNVVTKVIQTDIIKNDLAYYELDGPRIEKLGEDTREIWNIKLTFNRAFCGTTNEKTLKIVRGNTVNYIEYPDVIQSGGSCVEQNVRYNLESTGEIYDVDVNQGSLEKVKYNDIRFAYVLLKTYGGVLTLDIPIYNSNFGSNYHIKIVAPLNYLQNATK